MWISHIKYKPYTCIGRTVNFIFEKESTAGTLGMYTYTYPGMFEGLCGSDTFSGVHS